jgi:hypothetical protein
MVASPRSFVGVVARPRLLAVEVAARSAQALGVQQRDEQDDERQRQHDDAGDSEHRDGRDRLHATEGYAAR